jgi:hypothetical protein
MQVECSLDVNGQLIFRLSTEAQGRAKGLLYSRYSIHSQLVRNIIPLLSVETAAHSLKPAGPEFDIALSAAQETITLKINGLTFIHFTIGSETIDIQSLQQLSVFETRIIGRSPQSEAPYPQHAQPLERLLTPITDLHTHLSAQVSGADLIELGLKYDVLYPTVALDILKVSYKKDDIRHIPKRIFLPLAHMQSSGDGMEPAVPLTSLSGHALKTLQRALCLSPEDQHTFDTIEAVYYLREPFTKNLNLLPDILRAIAEDYAKQHIRYAELSSNAVLDTKWLRCIHDAMPEIERSTGVQLRFKAGLPRNLDDAVFGARITQYKRAAASPYVVGADILGYEINKTSHMHHHLTELAHWIKENQPEGILQIHAGENAKNLTNVREALQLAHDHGIRLHVGHSLYGIDEDTMKLAMELAIRNDIIVQFNADSNLATNNIDFPRDVPLPRFIKAGIPSMLGSDGAGMYLTSAMQIAMAGLYCGISHDDFKAIRAAEETYILRQQAVFDQKSHEFPLYYFDNAEATQSEKKAPQPITDAGKTKDKRISADADTLQKLIHEKCPILLAGAGGSSWNDVPTNIQHEIIHGLDLLLVRLDPDKIYFIKGRTKGSGVNIELERAIARYNDNEAHSKKFACVTMLAESEEAKGHTSPHSYTHMLNVPLLYMPATVSAFLKEHKGFAIYVGGRNFTRDFILASAQQNIPFCLMKDAKGASAEKARVYKMQAFNGAEGMAERVINILSGS